MNQGLVPAAQYLRMSTENQQYSLHNQADAIARYAAQRGFQIVRTYSDAARSGLRLKNRTGLKQLLKDVVGGQLEFRAVLVYDVSRWGRFQDTDEAAHYEYLCKSAGVPIHYCAEMFTNDNSMSDLIMKALKRTMAGEYSRELGVKVRRGLFNLASRGYRVGGPPGYGFRRQLIDICGNPKQLLRKGEHKSISTDRVILVPGTPKEVAVVRRIFRLFVEKRKNFLAIAETLNHDGIPFLNGKAWGENHVRRIIHNPQYYGTQVWGRTTGRLLAPVRVVGPEQWVTCPNAFEPIISKDLFDRAQGRIANFTCHLSNDQLIEKLEQVLKVHGKLNAEIIESSPLCPGAHTYYKRFGGLVHAYARMSIHRPELLASLVTRQRIRIVRKELFASFLREFPNDLQEVRPLTQRNYLVERQSGALISVRLAWSSQNEQEARYWLLDCHEDRYPERDRLTIVALLDQSAVIEQLRIFPRMNFPGKSIRLYE